MPYGQLVYNLRDYSGENATVSSDSLKEIKHLSDIDNLVEKGSGTRWSKVTIQAPPYSRWLVKQATGNKLDKIIRVGKSGVFEFDQEAAVEYLSYIPTYNNLLNKGETNKTLKEAINGFQDIEFGENGRKIKQYFIKEEERKEENLWYIEDFVKIVINVSGLDSSIVWQWVKDNHYLAPGVIQFNKSLSFNEDGRLIDKNGNTINEDIAVLKEASNKTFTFSLASNNLKDLFSSPNNQTRSKYDVYIAENKSYQENFMNYYAKYLLAQRGIYQEPNGENLTEIEPFNVIIDYYYDN